MDDKIAVQVLTKYFRKGNMARCLRDILPSANLTKEQRTEIADIVHEVVRWKRLYQHIIEIRGLKDSAETYLKLAREGAQGDAASYAFEYRYSCSAYVAEVLKDHGPWAEYLNESPPTTLCVNFNKSSADEVLSLLHKESLAVERSVLQTALLTSSIGKYSKVIQEHCAHVQDESSQFVSFLAALLGNSLFDFCAGNGGKSLALASMTKNKKKLSAYEINSSKRTILRQRCDHYNAKVIIEETVPDKTYDLVLVDAPCTGIGAARRNPEAKYVENAGDLPQTQERLLTQAALNVKPGGLLFYAVCTITPEETSNVIEKFLRNNEFSTVQFKDIPSQRYLLQDKHGFFTNIPRGDLFFISVLRKS
jgi:16S rRNA (cytosine967-C5)-methyltransferase